MKEFDINAMVTISIYTTVKANTKEEALEIARNRQFCSLGDPARFGDSPNEVWVHSGEIDGSPENAQVIELL